MSLAHVPKFLPVSPMYSIVHSGWSHLYLLMTPSLLKMLSLSHIYFIAFFFVKYDPPQGAFPSLTHILAPIFPTIFPHQIGKYNPPRPEEAFLVLTTRKLALDTCYILFYYIA